MTLALDYDLTAYDPCYVALAQQLDWPLVATDEILERKLKNSAIAVQGLATLGNTGNRKE